MSMPQVPLAVELGFDYLHVSCIPVCMRTTLNIDDHIYQQASQLTGIQEKTQLLHEGLKALIAQESGKRLALLSGSSPKLKDIPRR